MVQSVTNVQLHSVACACDVCGSFADTKRPILVKSLNRLHQRAVEGHAAMQLMQLAGRGAKHQHMLRRGNESFPAQNNHYCWAAVELAAVDIAANERSDFDWAVKAAQQGIAAIRPDGTLPQEMRRGKRALHYHLYAAAPLVMVAELAYPNGIDLYSERDGALKHLVRVSTAGLVNPSMFEKTSSASQEVPVPPTGEAIGWARPFNRRFPDPTIASLLAQCKNLSYMYLGGLPPE